MLRPASAEIAPGAEQCFTTRVVDAQGCAVRSQRVELSLASGGGRLEGRCYTAPGADAQATVVARAGSLSSEARVTVRSMDLSDLIARRSETDRSAAARRATRTPARGPRPASRPARPPRRSIRSGLRSRSASRSSWSSAAASRSCGGAARPSAPSPACPAWRSPSPSCAARRRPEPPAPTPADAAAPPSELPREDMICPSCRRGYPPGTDRCAADGATLVPYREFASAKGRENVCPACGERYPESVRFCGKDGTTLEPG
ncbi:MAG: hypothetical protein M5U28_32975 [Sandaracinaceae bacterium]|nr:hypothetical protein [Sandaracinaceae bacterium]